MRHREREFRDLLRDAAAIGGLHEALVERDYWMCQVASALVMESEVYPGSYTCMGGGSLLSLAGITQRLSEDVDITVTFADGADACSSNKSKRLMQECQTHAETSLGVQGTRDPNGGGNFFRTVRYAYPSVLPHTAEERSEVKSDKGLRDAPKEHLIKIEATPYTGRVAQSRVMPLPEDLTPRLILGTHPLQVLADKLDAVCWREALADTEGDKALSGMAARVRDHYDIHCLIKWLQDERMLDADAFAVVVERAKQQERSLRARMRLTRPEQDRPAEGYHTLRAWKPGTPEHSALASRYPNLRFVVFGELPSFEEVCQTIKSVEGVI